MRLERLDYLATEEETGLLEFADSPVFVAKMERWEFLENKAKLDILDVVDLRVSIPSIIKFKK